MKTFIINGIEYSIGLNSKTGKSMIIRADGCPVDNRMAIAKSYLLQHGWTESDFVGKNTIYLESHVAKLINAAHSTTNISCNSKKIPKKDSSDLKVDIASYVNRFTDVYQADNNGRYMSYDHCRDTFLKYRKDGTKKDLITLHLYAYLASWGMLRNSFLMQKDYLFSRPVIDILCAEKYDNLLEFNPFEDDSAKTTELILELVKEIRNYYLGQKYYDDGTNEEKTIDSVTDTLASKIILGTIGCTVAYDRYVKKGLSSFQLTQKINEESIVELIQFAKTNQEEIEQQMSKLNHLYTPMKIIDMYFFEKGFEIENTKG